MVSKLDLILIAQATYEVIKEATGPATDAVVENLTTEKVGSFLSSAGEKTKDVYNAAGTIISKSSDYVVTNTAKFYQENKETIHKIPAVVVKEVVNWSSCGLDFNLYLLKRGLEIGIPLLTKLVPEVK